MVQYWHMLLDEHHTVFSNGAATETLFPGKEALGAVSDSSRKEILSLYPFLADPAQQVHFKPCRPFVRGKQNSRLLERLEKNNKDLVDVLSLNLDANGVLAAT